MFQESGTTILTRARIKAQDNDANSNYAVGDSTALILLNDILVSLSSGYAAKPKWIAASTSGLTFTSGLASKVVTADIGAEEIESFHQSASSSLSYPLSPAIERVSVQRILEMYDYDGDTAVGPAASEWTHVAAEKATNDTFTSSGLIEGWRVYAYPVINATRSIHLRVPSQVTISALSDTPDIDTVNSRVLSSILAYKIALLKKETSQTFLDGIAREIPADIFKMAMGDAVRRSQLQDSVVRRNA